MTPAFSSASDSIVGWFPGAHAYRQVAERLALVVP
jgi:hypothetical protein